MSCLISRQAAIDALKGELTVTGTSNARAIQNYIRECASRIEHLPSVQPEIIRCKECRHSDIYPKDSDADMPLKCLGIRYGGVMPDWFCEHAERREDE